MKILNVNHLLDPQTGGGTAERTFQLSRFFSKAGITCTVVALDIGITPERVRALGDVRLVAVPCLNRRYSVPRISPSAMNRLVAEADIAHLAGHWTVLNALAYNSCRKLNKPFVFCPAGALKPFGRSLLLKRLYDAWIGRDIARAANACVAITEAERADFATYGVPPERVVVIPNGIDPGDYDCLDAPSLETLRDKYSLPIGPYVLFLGRHSEIKGPDLLLGAFAKVADRFPDIHLVFAGPDGGMLHFLMEMADKLSLVRRVHFIGYVGGQDKATLLRGARLLAIPSRHEAMSIVVLEAGICGTPVLFTDACGLEVFAREGAGTMVEASAEALAEGLSTMLSHEAEVDIAAERLSAVVQERYIWQMQADRYLALCSRLLTAGAL